MNGSDSPVWLVSISKTVIVSTTFGTFTFERATVRAHGAWILVSGEDGRTTIYSQNQAFKVEAK